MERKGHGIWWYDVRNQGRRENIEKFQARRRQVRGDGSNEIRDEIHVKIRIWIWKGQVESRIYSFSVMRTRAVVELELSKSLLNN